MKYLYALSIAASNSTMFDPCEFKDLTINHSVSSNDILIHAHWKSEYLHLILACLLPTLPSESVNVSDPSLRDSQFCKVDFAPSVSHKIVYFQVSLMSKLTSHGELKSCTAVLHALDIL